MNGTIELLLAVGVLLFVGWLVALRRISALKKEMAELKTETKEAQHLVTIDSDHIDCVIKCVGCGKYQVPTTTSNQTLILGG